MASSSIQLDPESCEYQFLKFLQDSLPSSLVAYLGSSSSEPRPADWWLQGRCYNHCLSQHQHGRGGTYMCRLSQLYSFGSGLLRRVARNLQWGGCLGSLGAKPPAARGQWGSGGEAPSCRRMGVWGQSPQPAEARGSGGGAPSARKFCIFFAKITSFLGLFW